MSEQINWHAPWNVVTSQFIKVLKANGYQDIASACVLKQRGRTKTIHFNNRVLDMLMDYGVGSLSYELIPEHFLVYDKVKISPGFSVQSLTYDVVETDHFVDGSSFTYSQKDIPVSTLKELGYVVPESKGAIHV
ncbi:hypothetical protein ACRHK7_06575 [Weissella tructae]|uniref:hypothetical protein n=1 Tax=Weissella tructae TaxID=887702 RepID=UPI003D917EDA